MSGNGRATLEVETQLSKLVNDLTSVRDMAKQIGKSFEDTSRSASDEIEKQEKRTKGFFDSMKKQGATLAENLKSDFKALMGLNMVEQSLKLSSTLKGTVADAFSLSDAINKVGNSFDINQTRFSAFQRKVVSGLGEMGLSTKSASLVLQGLMGSGVKGEDSIMEYAKTAGKLASVSNTIGSEGNIASGMAAVLRAQGKNPSDPRLVAGMGQDLNKAFQTTGKTPVDLLSSMNDMFSGMASDMRKKTSDRTMMEMAVAGQIGGPNAVKFLEEYLGKSKLERLPMDQLGLSGIIGEKGGLDLDRLQKGLGTAVGRIGSDPEMAAKILGISDDAAKGLVRLHDTMQQVRDATERMRASSSDLGKSFDENVGFSEAFGHNLSRVGSIFGAPLGALAHGGARLMQSASHHDLTSAAVVGGAGLLAAVLAGGGIRALTGVAGTAARLKGAEAMLGKETIPVYVVNISEFGGGAGLGNLVSKIPWALAARYAGVAGGVGAYAAGGYLAGGLIEPSITAGLDKWTGKKDASGTNFNILERFLRGLDRITDGMVTGNEHSPFAIDVTVRSEKGLNAKASQPRGFPQ